MQPDWILPHWTELTEFPLQRVVYQLSNLCRYAGATPYFYSVARHSLFVCQLVPTDPQLQMLALVHDAHECWTGDVLRPASTRFKLPLTELQNQIDQHLWALLGIDPDPIDLKYVAQADDTACKLEMQLLGKRPNKIISAMPGLKHAAGHLMQVYAKRSIVRRHFHSMFEYLQTELSQ